MIWKSWSISQWNSALIHAIFFSEGRAGHSISRIDANARFLAKCVDDPECSPEEVKLSFCRAFGTSVISIRSRYRWEDNRPLPIGGELPKSFAALYLTLMAGSADDDTFDLGDFRARFAELLAPSVPMAPTLRNFSFSELPTMWRYISRWSEKRYHELGDCGVLKLPYIPASEKLIGYSKRIAFPAYKDERRLKQALESDGLTANSEFGRVVRKIRSVLSQFSNDFITEFESFATLIAHHQLKDAFDSRFWCLIRDMSLEEHESSAATMGRYCLQIDVSDPFDPVPYLLFDDAGRRRLPASLNSLPVHRRDQLNHVAVTGNSYPGMIDIVNAMRTTAVVGSKLGRFLTSGCAVLLPDPFGALSSEGEFFEGGRVCFFATSAIARRLQHTLTNLQADFHDFGSDGADSGWRVISVESVSRNTFHQILNLAVSSIARLVKAGWTPPRVTLSGGTWHGQALLLNPASNPVARMPTATAGFFRLLDSSGIEVPGGEALEAVHDGFAASPFAIRNIDERVLTCEYVLAGTDGAIKSLKVHLARTLPPSRLLPLTSSRPLLCDGSSGVMQPIAFKGLEDRPGRPMDAGLPSTGFPPFSIFRVGFDGPKWSLVSADALHPALEWLVEALLLRFESSRTISFSQLDSHLVGAARAANVPPKLLRRLLTDGQWVQPVLAQNAPSASVAAAPRIAAMSLQDGMVALRVIGMLSSSDIAAAKSHLLPGESAFRVRSTDLSVGPLILKLASAERAGVFTELFCARLVTEKEAPKPLGALEPKTSSLILTEAPNRNIAMQPWITQARNWGSEVGSNDPWPIGEIRCPKNLMSGRPWFWLKASSSHYLKTDSLPWAWLAGEAASGRPIAVMASDGSVEWPSHLAGLPIALSRWWLLFGGGCVDIAPNGRTTFCGPSGIGVATAMGLRILGGSADSAPILDPAMERRELALRISQARNGSLPPIRLGAHSHMSLATARLRGGYRG
jgi:hypothetical protein